MSRCEADGSRAGPRPSLDRDRRGLRVARVMGARRSTARSCTSGSEATSTRSTRSTTRSGAARASPRRWSSRRASTCWCSWSRPGSWCGCWTTWLEPACGASWWSPPASPKRARRASRSRRSCGSGRCGIASRCSGPNVEGYVNYVDGVAPYGTTPPPDPVAGAVSVLSQSGTVAWAMNQMASDRGVGLRIILGVGNEAVIGLGDMFEWAARDPHTRSSPRTSRRCATSRASSADSMRSGPPESRSWSARPPDGARRLGGRSSRTRGLWPATRRSGTRG